MKTQDNEWYPIPEYTDSYEITKTGKTRSVTRLIQHGSRQRTCYSREISTRRNNHGYVEVRLSKDGVTKTHFLHRLLAQTFIPNELNKKEVNHRNGFKTDNRLQNLEWCSHEENVNHAYRTGLMNKHPRPVLDLFLNTLWKSEKEVSKVYGIPLSSINYYLNSNPPVKYFMYLRNNQ
jgi:hypothetical protein